MAGEFEPRSHVLLGYQIMNLIQKKVSFLTLFFFDKRETCFKALRPLRLVLSSHSYTQLLYHCIFADQRESSVFLRHTVHLNIISFCFEIRIFSEKRRRKAWDIREADFLETFTTSDYFKWSRRKSLTRNRKRLVRAPKIQGSSKGWVSVCKSIAWRCISTKV